MMPLPVQTVFDLGLSVVVGMPCAGRIGHLVVPSLPCSGLLHPCKGRLNFLVPRGKWMPELSLAPLIHS